MKRVDKKKKKISLRPAESPLFAIDISAYNGSDCSLCVSVAFCTGHYCSSEYAFLLRSHTCAAHHCCSATPLVHALCSPVCTSALVECKLRLHAARRRKGLSSACCLTRRCCCLAHHPPSLCPSPSASEPRSSALRRLRVLLVLASTAASRCSRCCRFGRRRDDEPISTAADASASEVELGQSAERRN